MIFWISCNIKYFVKDYLTWNYNGVIICFAFSIGYQWWVFFCDNYFQTTKWVVVPGPGKTHAKVIIESSEILLLSDLRSCSEARKLLHLMFSHMLALHQDHAEYGWNTMYIIYYRSKQWTTKDNFLLKSKPSWYRRMTLYFTS